MNLKLLLSQWMAREPAPVERPSSPCLAAAFDLNQLDMATTSLHEALREVHDPHPCVA
jgi:hypothetical protein